ncbi:MAG: hypothetical protein M1840_005206 [Geoglossum simile]|nr:MAG: hypothetical protein M1840_005206 [Geoglossum simile]
MDVTILRPQDPAPVDVSLVAKAKQVILAAPHGNLTPETHTKFRHAILGVLELSPNPNSAADWIVRRLTPHASGEEELLLAKLHADIYAACQFVRSSGAGRPPRGSPSPSGAVTPVPLEGDPAAVTSPVHTAGRSSNFSALVKSAGLCRITGDNTSPVDSCHIIAFSTSNTSNPRLATYTDLVRAMFGEEAWLALLTNVMDGSSDQGGRNINRLDNGIPMTPSCHRSWDTMAFVLVVDWSTYNNETKEFDATFQWMAKPQMIINCWNGPVLTMPSGTPLYAPMESGTTIPFRRIEPPPLPNGQQPDVLPLPSAHLLYVRETLMRIAHLVGAAGEWEYDDEGDPEYDDAADLVQGVSNGSRSTLGDDRNSPRTPSSDHKHREINCEQFPCAFSPACAPHFHVPSPLRTQLSPTALALDLAVSIDTKEPGYHNLNPCSLLTRRGSVDGSTWRGNRPGMYM